MTKSSRKQPKAAATPVVEEESIQPEKRRRAMPRAGGTSPIDREIVSILSTMPQATNKYIAEVTGASEVTVANRIEMLISNGLMRVTVQRNIRTMGYNLVALCDVYIRGASVETVAEGLATLKEAISVSRMIDDPQIVMLIVAKDVTHLNSLLADNVGNLNGVSRVDSCIIDVFHMRPGVGSL